MKQNMIILFSLFTAMIGCGAKEGTLKNAAPFEEMQSVQNNNENNMIDTLTIGGGCFWCVEAQLLQLKGVLTVASGYAGGQTKNPTYKEVCSGLTGHAEVIQVSFDTGIISLDELQKRFKEESQAAQKPTVQLRADKESKYDTVAQVMSRASEAGLSDIAFVSEN